jgi:hypothetical protein
MCQMVPCDRTDDVLDGWRTPDTSWMGLGADEEEIVFINVVEAAEERPLRCLTDEEEFLEWKIVRNATG